MGIQSQQVLESIPILPKGLRPADLQTQMSLPHKRRTGFFHSNGEWNFLYKHDGRMYRLPENLAIVLLNETHGHGELKLPT